MKPIVSDQHDVALLRRVHGRRFPRLRQIRHVGKILSPSEQLAFRASVAVLALGIVWYGAVFAKQYRVKTPAVGGRYVEAVVGSPELVNPLFAPLNDVDTDIARLVYSGLMRVDKKQRLVPDLAVSYELSEDKKTYTFALREDVVWHDGERFTADDVRFTIETIENADVNSPLYVSFQGVTVEALDEYHVRFTLKEPFAPFLSSLTVGILPEHIWSDVSPERMRLAQRNLQPIGTGPFQFQKLSKDEGGSITSYELARFDKHYRQAPYIKEFVFQFFAAYDGEGGAIQATRRQAVDGLHFVPHDLREQVQRKHIALHTLQLPQYTALFFNQTRDAALEAADTRAALAVALDKDRVLRESLNGEGQVIYSPILPGFPGYAPEIEKTPYSTEQANALLDKEWIRFPAEEYRTLRKEELLNEWRALQATSTEPAAENGTATATTTVPADEEKAMDAKLDEEIHEAQTFFRKDKDGRLLELELVTTDTNEYRHAAELVAGFWQEIGVKTNLSFIPPKDLSRTALKDRAYDVLLYGVIIGGDPDQYPFWHSSQVAFPGLNLSGYVNRNADALLETARSTAGDDSASADAYAKFQEIILADRPAVFLYTPTYTYATTDKIKGIELSRISAPADRFADVANWYIKMKGRWKF